MPNVCGDFTWGEVEDYCITISEGDQDTTGVGLEQLTIADLNVFPNPSTDVVHFSWKKQQSPAVISIVDLVGKHMHTTPFNSEMTTVNVSGFATGTYLYRIIGETGNVLFTGKLVIRH